jgi:hypothetical protein
VLSFHVDSSQLQGIAKALDAVTDRFTMHPDFRGLVCLEHDSVRHQIIVITLWDGDGLEDTQAESELAQTKIAAATDLGVSCTFYDVVGLVPSAVAPDAANLTPALAG